jgi:hypothetical protein
MLSLGPTITDRNEVHDEIRRINSGNSCYYSVKKLLSCLFFKILKNRIYRMMIFQVLYGCENVFLLKRKT